MCFFWNKKAHITNSINIEDLVDELNKHNAKYLYLDQVLNSMLSVSKSNIPTELYDYDKYIQNIKNHEIQILRENIIKNKTILEKYLNIDLIEIIIKYLFNENIIYENRIDITFEYDLKTRTDLGFNLNGFKIISSSATNNTDYDKYLLENINSRKLVAVMPYFLNPYFESNQKIESVEIQINGMTIKTIKPEKNELCDNKKYIIETNLAITTLNPYSACLLIYIVYFETPISSDTTLYFKSRLTGNFGTYEAYTFLPISNLSYQKLDNDEYLIIDGVTAVKISKKHNETILQAYLRFCSENQYDRIG